MPRKSEAFDVVAALRERRPSLGGSPCLACSPQYRKTLHQMLDALIDEQLLTSLNIVHSVLKEATGFPQTPDALRRHLSLHDSDRWNRCNVVRRGPVE